MMLQWKRLCVSDCTYMKSMLINFIQMSLCKISPMQVILYQFKKDAAAWKRLGCPQRIKRTWWQIVATLFMRFKVFQHIITILSHTLSTLTNSYCEMKILKAPNLHIFLNWSTKISLSVLLLWIFNAIYRKPSVLKLIKQKEKGVVSNLGGTLYFQMFSPLFLQMSTTWG